MNSKIIQFNEEEFVVYFGKNWDYICYQYDKQEKTVDLRTFAEKMYIKATQTIDAF